MISSLWIIVQNEKEKNLKGKFRFKLSPNTFLRKRKTFLGIYIYKIKTVSKYFLNENFKIQCHVTHQGDILINSCK